MCDGSVRLGVYPFQAVKRTVFGFLSVSLPGGCVAVVAVVHLSKRLVMPAVTPADIAAIGNRYGLGGTITVTDRIVCNDFQFYPRDSPDVLCGGMLKQNTVKVPDCLTIKLQIMTKIC